MLLNFQIFAFEIVKDFNLFQHMSFPANVSQALSTQSVL